MKHRKKKEKKKEEANKKEEKLVQSKHTHLHAFTSDHPVLREREIIRVKKKNLINWCFLLRI
jgi:hypothetical protein